MASALGRQRQSLTKRLGIYDQADKLFPTTVPTVVLDDASRPERTSFTQNRNIWPGPGALFPFPLFASWHLGGQGTSKIYDPTDELLPTVVPGCRIQASNCSFPNFSYWILTFPLMTCTNMNCWEMKYGKWNMSYWLVENEKWLVDKWHYDICRRMKHWEMTYGGTELLKIRNESLTNDLLEYGKWEIGNWKADKWKTNNGKPGKWKPKMKTQRL